MDSLAVEDHLIARNNNQAQSDQDRQLSNPDAAAEVRDVVENLNALRRFFIDMMKLFIHLLIDFRHQVIPRNQLTVVGIRLHVYQEQSENAHGAETDQQT